MPNGNSDGSSNGSNNSGGSSNVDDGGNSNGRGHKQQSTKRSRGKTDNNWQIGAEEETMAAAMVAATGTAMVVERAKMTATITMPMPTTVH